MTPSPRPCPRSRGQRRRSRRGCERGGRLIYAGAGTAGRLGVLDAAECGPTFGTDLVRAVIAGGAQAVTEPVEGAEDAFDPADLADVTAADAVVGISASGRTPYVLGALAHAREAGALTVAVVGNPRSRAQADVLIEVLTGPEVLAGSTRLTAGTAQKVVLNALSTAVMIRLGKAYGAAHGRRAGDQREAAPPRGADRARRRRRRRATAQDAPGRGPAATPRRRSSRCWPGVDAGEAAAGSTGPREESATALGGTEGDRVDVGRRRWTASTAARRGARVGRRGRWR